MAHCIGLSSKAVLQLPDLDQSLRIYHFLAELRGHDKPRPMHDPVIKTASFHNRIEPLTTIHYILKPAGMIATLETVH